MFNSKLKLLVFCFVLLLTCFVVSDVRAVETNSDSVVTAKAPKIIGMKAFVQSGKVESKETDSMMVNKDGVSYRIKTTALTQIRRNFGAKSSLEEIQVGDLLNVHGKWADDSKTVINANLIRDLSIQKRNGAFVGVITSVKSDGWVIETVNRGSQTVSFVNTTKFVNRQNNVITQDSIKLGDRVRVKGLWDKVNNTITQVSHVKDYSLPLKSTTATSSATVQ